MEPLDVLARSEPVNAGVAWLLTGVVALSGVGSLLAGDPLWAGFALFVAVVLALPPWSTGDWRVMVPWPLALVAAVAVPLRTAGIYPEIVGYFAVTALALAVAVELDAFTAVEMSRRFAVGFAVLTTLAIQGIWTMAQYGSDLWLGTDFLGSQRELQVDILAVTLVAAVLGTVFVWYFDRIEHAGSHRRPVGTSPEEDVR